MNIANINKKINFKTFSTVVRNYCIKENINIKDQSVKFKITRLDYDDTVFSQAMLNVKSRKARLKSGLICLEGKRLIQDALDAGIKPVTVFCTKTEELYNLKNLHEDIKFYKLPYKDMQLWSDLKTCPGIIAICKKPEPLQNINASSLPITVICDQVREPGNLGAIIRCAAGVGVSKILLTKGCVDLWETKVLRGACGAHFHIPIISNFIWDNFSENVDVKTNIFLAVNQPLIVSNILPCSTYYNVDYKSSNENVLVVGGETEGLSQDVFIWAKKMNGKAINIPLANNIESLNCVSALSVILFEIKRQLLS